MAAHQRTTTERGYGAEHQRIKKQWAPSVDRGQGYCREPVCLMTSRFIPPGSRWDLAHDRSDPTRSRYLGPAHVKCNRTEGARYGNYLRRVRGTAMSSSKPVRSRRW